MRYGNGTTEEGFLKRFSKVFFNDVVLAESETGNVKKIYFSKYLGIIAIESNDTLFVK